MLKGTPLLILICCLAGLSLRGQSYPTLLWQKFYGKGGNDIPTCIEKSTDGNLLVGGFIEENDGKSGCTNIWIVKLTPEGEQIWEREIGGSGCDELRDITATPDSGAIFVGITSSFIEHPEKGQEAYQGDYLIGKVDKFGDIEWLRTYGGLDVDQAYSIAEGNGGEYLVVGASNSQNFDVVTEKAMSNNWCVKIGDDGEKRTSWAFGGNKHDWAFSITATNWGDYIFAGYTNSEDIDGTERRSNGDGWIARVDRYGSMQWQKIFSGRFEDFFTKVVEDRDGRIIVVGNFESEDQGKQFWFLKLTSTGKKIYEQIFGDVSDEYGTSVAECDSGGYVMTGYSRYHELKNKYIKGSEDFWLIRLNGRGEVVWKNTYGGPDDERGIDVVEFSPGIYYALGQKVNNFGASGTASRKLDYWLLKVREENCDDIDIKVVSSLNGYQAYVGKNFKIRAVVNRGERFLWDFGDGTSSAEQEPVHTYKESGVYEVKVTVFVNENCAKTYVLPEMMMVW